MTKKAVKIFLKMLKETDITHLFSLTVVVPSSTSNSTLQTTTLGRRTFLKCFQLSSIQREEGLQFGVQCQWSGISLVTSVIFSSKEVVCTRRQKSDMFPSHTAGASSLQSQLLSEIVLRNNGTKTHLDSHLDSLCAHIYEHFPHQ